MNKGNELKLNRSLLDRDFPGYKLVLSPMPVHEVPIAKGVDVVEPSDDQYSFLHQREFSLHNHLYGDEWNPGSVYFFDTEWNLFKSWVNEIGRLEKMVEVWSLPRKLKRVDGHYNVSMCFASETHAVICDGAGSVFVLLTESRVDVVPWKVLYSAEVFGTGFPFRVVDARAIKTGCVLTVHCLLLYIESVDPEEKTSNKKTPGFQTCLKWLTLSDEQTPELSQISMDELKGKGVIDYAVLEPSGVAVYTISNVLVSSDKYKEIEDETEDTEENEENVHYDFEWSQNFDEVKIWFPADASTGDVKLLSDPLSLTVICSNGILLKGKLFNCIEPELCTWSISNNKLEVILQKTQDGAMWPTLIESEQVGKEIPDEELVETVHEKLAHLCSENEEAGGSVSLNSGQLEECDAYDEDSRTLIRFEYSTLKPTHSVGIGGQQWLLSTKLNGDSVSAFVVRNDVDGIVYQPTEPDKECGDWEIEHKGTFFAFGYVQASKTNKKFTVAAPDMSYIAIVDTLGHVMIYRRGVAVSTTLRNRKSGKACKELAVQNIIQIRPNSNIIGAQAFQQQLFVLAKDTIFAIDVV